MNPSEIDLTLHIDPAKPNTLDAEITTKIGGVVELDADIEVGPDGKPTVTIGIKIPIP